MTKPRPDQPGNWDRERADRLQKDVERMQKDIERLTMQAKGKDIDNLSAWYFRRALTMRADILRRTADELTDETGEQ